MHCDADRNHVVTCSQHLTKAVVCAAHQAMPGIGQLLCSPCGSFLAASTDSGLHTFQVDSAGQVTRLATRNHAKAPAPPTHITAMAFTAHCTHLLVASSEVPLAVMPVATLVPESWLQGNAALMQKLSALEGHITTCVVQPPEGLGSHHAARRKSASNADSGTAEAALGCAYVASHRSCCTLQLDALRAGAPVGGAGVHKPPRQRVKPPMQDDAPDAPARLWQCERGKVVFGAVWPEAQQLIVVQGDRERAQLQLPAPLDLQLYGEG